MVLTRTERARIKEIVAQGFTPAPSPVPTFRGAFGFIENVGALTLGNLFTGIQAGLGSLGLAAPGSVAERLARNPSEAFVFPSSLEAFFGLDPRQSGLARRTGGRTVPIPLDPSRGVTTSLEALLETIGGTGTIEQFVQRNPVLGRAVLTAAELGRDPTIIVPGAAGVRGIAAARGIRGFIPFSRTRAVGGALERLGLRAGGLEGAALRLREAGASESAVRNFLRAALPPQPSLARELLVGEPVREFFTRGRLFGRRLDPALSAFGRPVPTTAGRLAGQELRAFDAIEETGARVAAETATESVAARPLSTSGAVEVPRVAPEVTVEARPALARGFQAERRKLPPGGLPKGPATPIQAPPTVSEAVERSLETVLEDIFVRRRGIPATPPSASVTERLIQFAAETNRLPNRAQVAEIVQAATGRKLTPRDIPLKPIRDRLRDILAGRFAIRGAAAPGAQVAAVNLRRAAPGTTIQQVGTGGNQFLVTAPSKKTVFVDAAAVIEQPTGVVARLGRPLKEGEVVAGRTVIMTPEGRKLMGVDAFVQIRPGEGPEVFSDEFFHVMDELDLFTKPERASLQRKFARGLTDADQITEAMAEGVGRWMGQRARNEARPDSLLERAYRFFLGLFEDLFGPTAAGTLRRIERGEILRRPAPLIQPGLAGEITQTERFAVQTGKATDPASLMAEHVQRGDDFTTLGARLSTAVAGIRGTLGRIAAKPSEALTIIEETPLFRGIRRKMFNKTLDAMDAMLDTNERAVSAGVRTESAFATNPEYLSANLPGLIQREAEILGQSRTAAAHGIPNPTADAARFAKTGNPMFRPWLFKGSWERQLHAPLRKHLISTTGEATTEALAALREQAGHLAVSERAIGEADEVFTAVEQAAEGLQAMRAGPDVPFLQPPSKLINTNLMTADEWRGWAGDAGVSVEDITAILRERAGNWTDSFTGVGKTTGQSDLSVHRAFVEQMRAEGKLPALQETIEINRRFHIAKLEYGFRKGLISEEVFTSLLEKQAYFTGLQRLLDEGVGGGGGNILHLFHGSGREIRNPITTTAENVIQWVQRADRNKVMQEWARMLGDLDGVGADVSHIATRATLEDFNAQTLVEVGRQKTRAIKKILVDGDPQYWNFTDNQVALAIDKVGRRAMRGPLMTVLAIPARILRWTVTRSPFFAARNLIRDNFQRIVVSQHGGGPWDIMKRATPEEVADLIHRGASFGGWDIRDFADDFAKVQARFTRSISTDKNTVLGSIEGLQDGGAAVLDKLDALPAFSERVGRLAEYRNALTDVRRRFPGIGQADAQVYAAKSARGLLDFAVAGEWGEQISTVTAFFNPAIQGARVTFSALRRNPRRFMATTLAYISAADLATYAWNKGVGAEREWQNLPSYRKDFYWNMKVGPYWLTIPKPFEVGVFGSLPARTVNFADGNPGAFKGYVKSIFVGLSPVDESLLAGPFKPFLEAIANRDFFRGYYIVPPHEEGLALELRRGAKKASRISKGISDLLKGLYEIDPRILDQLIRSQTGDIGRLALDVSSVATPGQPRRGVFRTLIQQGGLFREPSTFSAESVEEAIEFDRRFRLTGTRGARRLRALARQAADAETVTEKSALVQRLLEAAGRRRLQQRRMNTRDLIRRQLRE